MITITPATGKPTEIGFYFVKNAGDTRWKSLVRVGQEYNSPFLINAKVDPLVLNVDINIEWDTCIWSEKLDIGNY